MNTNCILFKQTKKKKIKQMFCREGWGGSQQQVRRLVGMFPKKHIKL